MLDILKASEFKIAKREPLLDFQIYADEAEDLRVRVTRISANLADKQWMSDKTAAGAMKMARSRAWYAVDLLALSYSAGIEINQLRDFYPIALDYWEDFAKYDAAFDDSSESEGALVPHFELGGDDFEMVNRMVCLGILLGHPNLLPRLAFLLEYRNPRMDGMLERLLAPFVPGRGTPPSECTRHLPYFKTLKIFDAHREARPMMIAQYLEEWYNASRREPYYDSHKRDNSFFGYWAWEAAAITLILDVDDEQYKNSTFYPKNLVEFARSELKHSLLESKEIEESKEIRVKSGDRCPHSGMWETLNQPAHRKFFNKGEVMSGADSAYGYTVWLYKGDV